MEVAAAGLVRLDIPDAVATVGKVDAADRAAIAGIQGKVATPHTVGNQVLGAKAGILVSQGLGRAAIQGNQHTVDSLDKVGSLASLAWANLEHLVLVVSAALLALLPQPERQLQRLAMDSVLATSYTSIIQYGRKLRQILFLHQRQ